jgi:hypothetical protein
MLDGDARPNDIIREETRMNTKKKEVSSRNSEVLAPVFCILPSFFVQIRVHSWTISWWAGRMFGARKANADLRQHVLTPNGR